MATKLDRLLHWAVLQTIKQRRGCRICGTKQGTLVFHHTSDTGKHGDLSKMLHLTLPQISYELKKCVVLCDGCHSKWHGTFNYSKTKHSLFPDFCETLSTMLYQW